MATDYAALAKQYGGSTVVDYSSLAQKYGGTTVTPPQDPVKPTAPAQKDSIVRSTILDTIKNYQDYPSKIAADISSGAQDMQKGGILNFIKGATKSALRTTGDTVGTIFAPISSAIGATLNQTGAQGLIDKAGAGIANMTGLADNKAFQDFAMKHPQAADDFGRALNLIMSGAGNENIDLKGAASDTFSGAKAGLDTVKTSLTKTPEEVFNSNLKTAEQVIYPKLTAKETSTIPLKEKGGLLGTKSVPDLQSSPQIKSVLEAVARLPEDIQPKITDTPKIIESKLDQGISRIHQGTEGYLFDKKAETSFTPKQFLESFQKKVVDPTAREFGYKSAEVDAMSEAYNVLENLIDEPDAHGVYKARQELQGVMKDRFPNAFKKNTIGLLLDSKAAAKVDAFKTLRNFANDFISEDLLKPNDPYRARLKEESNLINAKEQYRRRNTDQVGKNRVERYLNRSPKVKAAVSVVGRFTKLGGAIDSVKHF